MTASTDPVSTWTCPFCPLLCDDLLPDPARWRLPDSACPRAREGLAGVAQAAPAPRLNGAECSLDEATAAAARVLSRARQPLLSGLGGDVAAMRASFRLAAATGAICDAAGGEALTQALRVQQDRGGFTATLAELRERADLVVAVGSWPEARAPRLLERIRAHRDEAPALVALGAAAAGEGVEEVLPRVPVFDSLPMLTALVAGRRLAQPNPELQVLAERLRAARYAVLVWEPAQLGSQAALLIEQIQRIVVTLNATTRAAGFPLGGGQGAATANQVFTWLGGLPLRTRVAPAGLRHEPLTFSSQRLLAADAVDALLWINPFDGARPPATPLPRIVLGPAALASALGDESNTVYIPVATPGLHHPGHLFRTDGVVLMPLFALPGGAAPRLAEVVERITTALEGRA